MDGDDEDDGSPISYWRSRRNARQKIPGSAGVVEAVPSAWGRHSKSFEVIFSIGHFAKTKPPAPNLLVEG